MIRLSILFFLLFFDFAYAMSLSEQTKHKKKPKENLLQSITKIETDNQLSSVKKLLTRLDELFVTVILKIQTLDNLDVPGQAITTNLFHFLSGPHDKNQIIAVINKNLNRPLTENETQIITKMESPSLVDAIRALYKAKSLTLTEAHKLMECSAPMNAQEITKLLELGAVQTKNGQLIQMRTGGDFGNPTKLFTDFYQLADKISESYGQGHNKINASTLLTLPLSDRIVSAYNEPPAVDILSDARVLSEIRRHFVFLSRINLPISFRPGTVDFRPNAISTNGAPVDNVNHGGIVWALLKNLNAVLMGNHYFAGNNSSLTNSVMLAPFSLTYWGNYNWTSGGVGWWMNYTDKYFGIGATYTQNFASGAFWSQGAKTYLQYGATVSGWRNNLTAGVSLMTMMSSKVGAGASLSGTITRDHDVYYQGQYPLDGRFVEIRGLHKIEIDDRKGIALQEVMAANFSNVSVPIMVAFRAGQAWTTHRVFRTYVDLKKTARMLSEADIPGVLFLLGKDIEETKLTKTFMQPENFKVGDELVETKTGTLSGAFVVGLQSQLPIAATRLGLTGDLTAEFELALRRLPGNFFEVSIEPKRIYERGIFASILNTLGAGYIKTVSIARKQSFIFDFNVADARTAYFALVDKGMLPTTSKIHVYKDDRGPEYLLSEFRAQNKDLEKIGIALNYVEHIDVSSDKIRAGFNARMISGTVDLINIVDRHTRKEHKRLNLRFDGIDREYMHAHGESISSNGIVSVKRTTYAARKSKGQGFSGRYNRDIYVTHRRIHTIDEESDNVANRWYFDSLLVHAQYEDTLITHDEENGIAKEINGLFGTFIGSFKKTNSRQPRVINLEREFTLVDLTRLSEPNIVNNIHTASQLSGISPEDLHLLLDRLKDKHPDEQALILKCFIGDQKGVLGFAALHHLLGGQHEALHIRSEANYHATIAKAKKFIATFADGQSDLKDPRVNLHKFDTKKDKKRIKGFYEQAQFLLGEIETQLRLLEDDQFLIDDDSEVNNVYKKDVARLIEKGVFEDKKSRRIGLTSARETIRKELNLQKQGYTENEINAIYEIAGRKILPIRDLSERLIARYSKKPLTLETKKTHLEKRYESVRDLIVKLNQRLNLLPKDAVMIEMDKKYVDDITSEFLDLRARLVSLVDTRQFKKEELAYMQKQVGAALFDEVITFMTFLDESDRHNPVNDSKIEVRGLNGSSTSSSYES